MSGRLRAKEVPISPDMDETIGWLRADVPDDQIIAGALELSWQNLASRVAIAASDRNVRNKSRMAGLTPVKTESLLGSGN